MNSTNGATTLIITTISITTLTIISLFVTLSINDKEYYNAMPLF
jgi:hypothetical protein